MEDDLVKQSDLQNKNVRLIQTFEELDQVYKNNHNLRTVFLGSDTLEQIPSRWLRDVYTNGVIIAVINTPFSELADVLQLDQKVDDIELNSKFGRVGVSAVRYISKPDVIEGYEQLSEYFSDFATVSEIVNLNFIVIAQVAGFHSSQKQQSLPYSYTSGNTSLIVHIPLP